MVERAGRIGLRRLLRIPVRRLEMKMKRLLILLILAMTIFEPKPVEVKPVLVSSAKQWDLTKAYYQKVTMPENCMDCHAGCGRKP